MEEEIWRDIEDFEGLYQVSNLGRVKSLPRFRKSKNSYLSPVKEKIKAQRKLKNGYMICHLWKNNSRKVFLVHRLVAKAFPEICGELTEGLQIDHINTVRDDNRVENLKVCTRKENCNNPLTLKLRKELWKNDSFILKRKKSVVQLSKDGTFCKVYDSAVDAQKENEINRASICMCCNGKKKSAGGYYWFYLEDEETKKLIYD